MPASREMTSLQKYNPQTSKTQVLRSVHAAVVAETLSPDTFHFLLKEKKKRKQSRFLAGRRKKKKQGGRGVEEKTERRRGEKMYGASKV